MDAPLLTSHSHAPHLPLTVENKLPVGSEDWFFNEELQQRNVASFALYNDKEFYFLQKSYNV